MSFRKAHRAIVFQNTGVTSGPGGRHQTWNMRVHGTRVCVFRLSLLVQHWFHHYDQRIPEDVVKDNSGLSDAFKLRFQMLGSNISPCSAYADIDVHIKTEGNGEEIL